MTKYRVYVKISTIVHVDVEAAGMTLALEKAEAMSIGEIMGFPPEVRETINNCASWMIDAQATQRI